MTNLEKFVEGKVGDICIQISSIFDESHPTLVPPRLEGYIKTVLSGYKALIVKEVEGILPGDTSAKTCTKGTLLCPDPFDHGYQLCLDEVKDILKKI